MPRDYSQIEVEENRSCQRIEIPLTVFFDSRKIVGSVLLDKEIKEMLDKNDKFIIVPSYIVRDIEDKELVKFSVFQAIN